MRCDAKLATPYLLPPTSFLRLTSYPLPPTPYPLPQLREECDAKLAAAGEQRSLLMARVAELGGESGAKVHRHMHASMPACLHAHEIYTQGSLTLALI